MTFCKETSKAFLIYITDRASLVSEKPAAVPSSILSISTQEQDAALFMNFLSAKIMSARQELSPFYSKFSLTISTLKALTK